MSNNTDLYTAEQAAEPNDKSGVSLQALIKPYLYRWPWFVLGIFLGLLTAWFILRYYTNIYSTESTVLIKEVNKSSGTPDMAVMQEIGAIGGMGTNSVDNEIEIFKSKKLMQSVVRELGLETSLFAEGKVKSVELYKAAAPIKINIISEKKNAAFPSGYIEATVKGNEVILSHDNWPKAIAVPYNKAVSLPFAVVMIRKNPSANTDAQARYKLEMMSSMSRARQFLSQLTVSLINKNATVIQLKMVNAVPEKSEDILNRLAIAYNRDAILDKNSEAQKTADFIEGRIKIIGDELGAVEGEKERFKVQNNIADIEAEAQISLQTSAETRRKQLEADAQLELANSLLSYLNRQGSYQVLPLNVGLTDGAVTGNIAVYNQLVIERNRLLENSTPANPVVVDITKQINNMRSAIVQSLQKSRNEMQLLRDSYRTEQNQIAGKISKIPSQEKMFRSIERQQSIKENLYLLLLQKREEAAISLAIAAPKARIVDYALTTGIVSPNRKLFYGAAAALGLLLPLFIIYIRELFNNKIKSKHDLEKLAGGYTVIGEIPSVKKGQEELVQMNDLTPMAEAFRILITNLNFMLPKDRRGKTIMVSSSVKGEGKTFISVNLALTLATPNRKVLIIGADIRNPQLQRYNTSRKGLQGLTEFLHDSLIQPDNIIHKSSFNPYLDVVYSGAIAPNPAELLSNGRFEILLEQIRDHYDFIVLDTAPLLLITDSFLISHLPDATLYVTRSNFTEKELISFAVANMKQGRIKNPAFVLNDVDKQNFGYGNKYGYGYGAEKQSFIERIRERLKL